MKGLTLQVRDAIQSGFLRVHGDLVGVKESVDGVKESVDGIRNQMSESKSEFPNVVALGH